MAGHRSRPPRLRPRQRKRHLWATLTRWHEIEFSDGGYQRHDQMSAAINSRMNPRRDATKAVKRFHERWLKFLLNATPQTLRRVAHELGTMEEANQGFRDGAILTLLRRELEFAIQDIGDTDWSVARSQNDLRGRSRGRRTSHERVRIASEVHRTLRQHVSPLDSR